EQLVRVATGYGVHTEIWHTYGMIERHAPAALPAMRAARQQNGQLDFAAINHIDLPVAWASMVLLLGLIALAIRRARFADLGSLALRLLRGVGMKASGHVPGLSFFRHALHLAGKRKERDMAQEKFIIEPHFRLQEWVAEEKGYFKDEGLHYVFRELIQSTDGKH